MNNEFSESFGYSDKAEEIQLFIHIKPDDHRSDNPS